MSIHLVHFLVLTPFEASLSRLDWPTVAAQDYAVHALYCKESNRLLFHSDQLKNDCAEEISKICSLLEKSAIQYVYEQQILILSDNENEYSEQDVLRHCNH